MSKIEVDAITEQSGSTLTTGGGAGKTVVVDASTVTLGRCGGTVALASGASQTGFGRNGSVNWQTGSIKTTGFTAANGEGYFCNTSGAAFTVTLPSSPSAGDIVAFADYTRSFGDNNLTIGRNSQPIGGIASDAKLTVTGQAATFVYVDGTEGWINVQNAEDTESGLSDYVIASGGTVTTCGDHKIHQFTGPGTFAICQAGTPSGSNTLDYLVVAGGGSGFASALGGGGAGGFRMAPAGLSTPVMGGSGSYPVTIGAGGAKCAQNQGSNSIFSSITSAGGGAGGNSPPSQDPDLSAGGSGGAIGRDAFLAGRTSANNGNLPPTTPSQGNPGGVHNYPTGTSSSAGGGGHAGSGAGNSGQNAGSGGAGSPAAPVFGSAPKPFYIANGPANGASACGQFAGGGGGGTYPPASSGGNGGSGGVGGGGNGGGGPTSTVSNAGTANTGGGGGGNYGPPCGAAGGSGIVLIRYKFQN